MKIARALMLTYLFLTHTFLFAIPSLQEMTLEEKVGQLLMVHFNGTSLNQDSKALIGELHVGAFIYYNWSNGLTSPEQVRNLSASLQAYAHTQPHAIPLLIAIDQEGGPVARLTAGFPLFPSQEEIALTGNPEKAYAVALAIGKQLRSVGINVNLAPVADINSHPTHRVLGKRSFGTTPDIVTRFVRASLRGYRDTGILATLKHFPGYGEATVDPHLGLPVVRKSKAELEATELAPFRTLASQTPLIMSAHILFPAFDPERCATLSPLLISGLLRTQWRFRGLILTDSLIMRGITDVTGSVDEAVVQAFEAGHDILLLGGKLLGTEGKEELTLNDIRRIHRYLVDAVKSGRISSSRLDESVQRILNAKQLQHP